MLEALVKRFKPLPENSTLLILGGGFSGQCIGALARALGAKVICTRRDINQPGADFVFNSENQTLPPQEALVEITHLLSCIPPTSSGKDPVLSCLQNQLQELPLKWAGYISTTGVYGDRQGEWVTELDTPKPQQERSKRRLACEQDWEASGLPVQILRLPGIYGPGRSAIEIVQAGKTKMVHKPNQIFSRIHVEDIAGATMHLIQLAAKGKRPRVINIADDRPSSNTEVLTYAASLTGNSLPPIEPFEVASQSMSPMALSFWQENRRVSNQMLCKELGYCLLHPDYKSGLLDCFLQNK